MCTAAAAAAAATCNYFARNILLLTIRDCHTQDRIYS